MTIHFTSAVGVGFLGLFLSTTSQAASFEPVAEQHIAVPSYFYPGALWDRMRQGAPTLGLAIINPNSGPGSQVDENYANEVRKTQDRGILVLGYVATGYGIRSLKTVKSEIDRYQTFYPVDGIFLDEAASECANKNYYRELYRYIKTKQPSATVTINPGDATEECYARVADIIMNFEGSYEKYQKWKPAGWEAKYEPNRFWHAIYNTPQTGVDKVVRLSRQKNAGWIYITPDRMNNPWDTLPNRSYWQHELNQVGN